MRSMAGILTVILVLACFSGTLMAEEKYASDRTGYYSSLFPGNMGMAILDGSFAGKYRDFIQKVSLVMAKREYREIYSKADNAFRVYRSATGKARELLTRSTRYSSAMRSVAGQMIDSHRRKAARYRDIYEARLDVLSKNICRYLSGKSAVPRDAGVMKMCLKASRGAIADSIR